jgi:hypothetical protein
MPSSSSQALSCLAFLSLERISRGFGGLFAKLTSNLISLETKQLYISFRYYMAYKTNVRKTKNKNKKSLKLFKQSIMITRV